MKIHRCVVTGKEKGYYQASFIIEKHGVNYRVLGDYYTHDINIVASEVGFTPREKQTLAGEARIAKETWEKEYSD